MLSAAAGSLLLGATPEAIGQTVVVNFLTGGSPNYSSGNSVGQNATVTGFTGAWGTPGTSNATISATNLTFSNGSGTVANSEGSVSLDPVAGRVFRNLTTAIATNSNSVVYMSLVQNPLTSINTQ